MPLINVGGSNFQCETVPDECPVCHQGVQPLAVAGFYIGDITPSGGEAQLVFKCPRHNCGSLFIGYFRSQRSATKILNWLSRTGPFTPKPPSVPDEISKVSPSFVAIFTQAMAAEGYELDEIAGVGYRKALEFLIKDFCVREHPSDEEAIKTDLLGTVINRFVDDARIKVCAERAAWLGNDETHYVRRWTNQDIEDLKTLIDLTVGWIRSHILTQQYLSEMDKRGKVGAPPK